MNLSHGIRDGLVLVAVAITAPLWILDEPFVALDVAAVSWLAKIIGDHVAGGGIQTLGKILPLPLVEDAGIVGGNGRLGELRVVPQRPHALQAERAAAGLQFRAQPGALRRVQQRILHENARLGVGAGDGLQFRHQFLQPQRVGHART